MATINEFTATLDGTTLKSNLTITVQSRTATSVTFSYTAYLGIASYGSTSAGYETYTGHISISGTNITTKSASITFKPLNTSWGQGSGKTVTGTITCSTSSASSLTANVSYYFKSTIASSGSTQSSSTKTTSLSTGAGTITPTAPTISLAAKPSNSSSYYYIGYNPDSSVTITCSGGANIAKYKYQYSVGNGWVDLTTTTSSSYTATGLPALAAGKTLSFQVVVYSTTNNSATATLKTLYYAYYTPSAPTFITPAKKTVVDAGTVINCSWEAPPQTVTSYSIRVVVNGEVKNSTVLGSTTTSWSYGKLEENETAYFEIAATNASGSSQYTKSPTYTTIALMPAMVPVYVMVNGSWQPISVTTLINNE